MSDAGIEGGMVAVIGLDRDAVAAVIDALDFGSELVVANDNAPGQVVISGTPAALAAVTQPLHAAGARREIALRVSGPFHSPLMVGVGKALSASFGDAAWSDAAIPVISNVTAQPVRQASEIRGLLARQVHSPVEWVRSVRFMAGEGVDTFVECGPGAALTGMVRRIVPGARLLNVADDVSLADAVVALAAAPAGVPA